MFAIENNEKDFIKSISFDLIAGKKEAFNRFILRYQEFVYQFAYKLLANHSLAVQATRDAFVILYDMFRESEVSEKNVKEHVLRACAKSCTKYGTIIPSKDILTHEFDNLENNENHETHLPEDFLFLVMDQIYNKSGVKKILSSLMDSVFIKITAIGVIAILVLLIYNLFTGNKTEEKTPVIEQKKAITKQVDHSEIRVAPPKKQANYQDTTEKLHVDKGESEEVTYIPPVSPAYDDPKVRQLKKTQQKSDKPVRKHESKKPIIEKYAPHYMIYSSKPEEAYAALKSVLPATTRVLIRDDWSDTLPTRFVLNPLNVRFPSDQLNSVIDHIGFLLKVRRVGEDPRPMTVSDAIQSDLEREGIAEKDTSGKTMVEVVFEFVE